jgi:RNA polymerase sigma factor (TIGR02999 family)
MLLRLVPADRHEDITGLIQLWQTGDREAESRLFELVLPDLRRIAHNLMRRERSDHTLQATELVSQIYLKLVAAKDRTWHNRVHFFALAARAMRNYLIDYARARPNAQIVSLEAMPFEGFGAVIKSDPDSLLNLNRLLDELAIQDSEACSIVELKYFLGLSDEETAEILGVNVRTLQRHWQDARRWLYVRLRGAEERDQKS